MNMPKLYVMVGIPGSGKSTWIKNQEWAKDCVVVSTDEFVEAYAREQGKTYSEVFQEYMPTAIEMMMDKVAEAEAAGKDIIWDQTSVNVATRARKVRRLPQYHKVAVVFKVPHPDDLIVRLASRPGKIIPLEVVADMVDKFNSEPVTEEEGFDEIWYT